MDWWGEEASGQDEGPQWGWGGPILLKCLQHCLCVTLMASFPQSAHVDPQHTSEGKGN